MKEWIELASDKHVRIRALKYAIVVGFILIMINHGDSILNGTVTDVSIVQMTVTVFVPYFVSTFSSVGAIMKLHGKNNFAQE